MNGIQFFIIIYDFIHFGITIFSNQGLGLFDLPTSLVESDPSTVSMLGKNFAFMPMYTNIVMFIFHRVPDLKLVVMASKDHERTFRLILTSVDF